MADSQSALIFRLNPSGADFRKRAIRAPVAAPIETLIRVALSMLSMVSLGVSRVNRRDLVFMWLPAPFGLHQMGGMDREYQEALSDPERLVPDSFDHPEVVHVDVNVTLAGLNRLVAIEAIGVRVAALSLVSHGSPYPANS